jgi:polyisoprenoid-binding protein YceI
MNRMMTAAASIAAAALLPTTALAAPTWTLDVDHSQVGFKVRHMMVSYSKGRFLRFQGTVLFDDAHPEDARIDVTIDAASIDTHLEKRDEHLRSADFLDVKNHPTLTFKSTKVKKVGEGRLEVLGNLTLRGVTRPVTLLVSDVDEARKDPWGGVRRGATATTRISRKDFGLTWNVPLETGGVVLGDEVHIQLDLELIQQAPQPTAQQAR